MKTFDEFWKLYPRRIQKVHAQRAYKKVVKSVGHEKIMSGLNHQLLSGGWKDIQFVPYPATWLNRGGWEFDEVAPEPVEEAGMSRAAASEVLRGLLGGDSHPSWDAAVSKLRGSDGIPPYAIREWFDSTRGILKGRCMYVYCLDDVNAQWLHREYQEYVDAALQMPWQAVSIEMLDPSHEEPEEL